MAELRATEIPVKKYVSNAIGDNLRAYRRRNRLDQERVAARMRSLGIPWRQVTVSESELGRRSVTVAELLALTLVLGVPIEALIDPLVPDERGKTWGALLVGGDTDWFPFVSDHLTAFVCGHKQRLEPATWADDNSIFSVGFRPVTPDEDQP